MKFYKLLHFDGVVSVSQQFYRLRFIFATLKKAYYLTTYGNSYHRNYIC